MAAAVARRGLLQAGALTGGLTLVGLRPNHSLAAPLPSNRIPLSGLLGEHIRLDLARGAVIRMAQLDHTLRPVQEFGEVRMPLADLYDGGRPSSGGTPLQRVCSRAQALALTIVAADWEVPSDECRINHCAIVHTASGRTIGYKAWVDVV